MSTFSHEWTGAHFFEEIVSLSRDVVHALYLLISSLVQLFGAILRPTIIFLRPVITTGMRLFWIRFISQSWRTILTQCMLLALSGALAFFEKRYCAFSRAYYSINHAIKRSQEELRKRSRMAAAVFPHFLFVTSAFGVEYLFQASASHSARSVLFIAFARVKPALYSVNVLSNHRHLSSKSSLRDNHVESTRSQLLDLSSNMDKRKSSEDSVRKRRPRTAFTNIDQVPQVPDQESLLRYWSVISVIFGIRQIMHFLIPSYFSSILFKTDVFALYLTFWLQSSLTNGTDIGYNAISAMFGKRIQVRTGDTRAQVGVVLSILVSIGVLTSARANQVSSTLAESGVALVGFVFLITPQIVTFFGTVFVGWLAPAYLNAVPCSAIEQRRKWLTYFAVYAVVDVMFEVLKGPLSWFPLLYHLKMLLILWLQLPFYQGATLVLEHVQGHTNRLASSVTRSASISRKLVIFDIRLPLIKYSKTD